MTASLRRPRYPIYIPSRGRSKTCLTAKFLQRDGVAFRIVVEPNEAANYKAEFGADRVLVLPESDQGIVYARNWIRDHAVSEGVKRHWQLDDNIRKVQRVVDKTCRRIACNAGPAFAVVEDLADRYENVALAGMNYSMFTTRTASLPAFTLNVHVYSCTLMLNDLPFRFRGPLNEDVDLCLQVLSAKWCTILVNAFVVDKIRTMMVRGGNEAAYSGNGRIRGLRGLARRWPGVVTINRRYGRAHFKIRKNWQQFTTELKRCPDAEANTAPDSYGLSLAALSGIKSSDLQEFFDRYTEPGE